MPIPRARSGAVPAALLASLLSQAVSAAPAAVGDAVLIPVAAADLPGFPGARADAALAAFRRVCAAPPPALPQPDGVAGDPAALAEACAAATDPVPDAAAFFRDRFAAFRVARPGADRPGFLTGYFEPELTGSLEPGPDFPTPVLARPDDLISLGPGETRPGLDPGLRAARATADGFAPYPDRAAIEDGALGARAKPILWLRDPVDLLVLQVQGSGRVRLPDGRAVRVLYDGRNGRPYTAVAKLIVQEGHLPLEGLTLARWTGWLRAHPETAKRLIRANASYIFFRLAPVADPALGPPGAANAPLSPGRSLAVDSTLWRYGLPFWLAGPLPAEAEAGAPDTAGRLVVAADTGSAIVGPARGDLFVGTGPEAGAVAGNLRDAVGFVVLLPRRGGASGAAP
ncbi:murein transglycosylase A [Methylobacterium radiotolerans]|uniref:murein transglycosylase A n=1 Tax=Methylobacterium radiotolerans TaxID=31998 RepID=UPI000D5F524A|nr:MULTISPECIES: MltA domain-containing protein [Methylobacterium]MDE3744492.1 MltA domain-containing protein [Methylobacterium radiotolerans]PVZ04013.1 membrane-bound lytic murein transglycosylase A [Methylobacterium organophilum]